MATSPSLSPPIVAARSQETPAMPLLLQQQLLHLLLLQQLLLQQLLLED